jgi:hypothetical protein
MSTGSTAKRQRVNGLEGVSNGSPVAGQRNQSFDVGHGRADTIPAEVEEEGEEVRVPGRAPVAPMIAPAATRLLSKLPAPQVEPDHNDNNSRPQSSSSSAKNPLRATRPRPQPSSPSFQPGDRPFRKTAVVDESLDMPPLQEKRSSPYALSGSSLNLPFDADTALVKSTKTAAADKPSKPKLFYILPNSRGVLDHENPLPRETWWACDLAGFFNLVAHRAGKPDGSLECLTFTYNWAPQEPFVVHRLGGNQYWDEIRERVKGTFLKTRNSTKKRTKFELWIECGDTTNLDEVDEEDEDC